MQEAVPTGGAMTAILGLDSETIAKACEETEGIVSVANYNCPGQTVITGEAGAGECGFGETEGAGSQALCAAEGQRAFPFPYAERQLERSWDRCLPISA